jgi:hypothetical protein
MTQALIAGEPIDAIGHALLQFEITPQDDGMVHAEVSLEPEVAAPLRRALLRIEGELLQQEADQLTAADGGEERTDDQRRYDAMMELIRRFAAARRAAPTG